MHRASRKVRLRHALQREIGRVLSPLWTIPAAVLMRFGYGYRIEGLSELRAQYRRIRGESSAPLLICANHLTLIDSFLVAWALAPPWRYATDFDALPWNTPEKSNFASNFRSWAMTYLAKCIPISRGGSREGTAGVIGRVSHLLGRGETALVFPEGGRSRSGRVQADSAAWGVGRIVAAVPRCRVLCVYLRGRSQQSFSDRPERGERFDVSLACIEPKSDFRGARSWRDLVNQVISQLSHMEREYFANRRPTSPITSRSDLGGRQ